MQNSVDQLPDLSTLTDIFNSVLCRNKSANDQITILARESNPYTSTYSSEVVTCQLADGSELRLLCKYSTGRNHNAYGHRGGVAYEAEVYHHVLQPLTVSTPTFYGLHRDAITGETWFIIEYLDKSSRISFDPTFYHEAARWLGQFHKINEPLLSRNSLPFLHRYDAEYYLGWADRTLLNAGQANRNYPWLATLCQRFKEVVNTLMEPPAIIIHGEYYPDNLLRCEGAIYPVDWESTAVAIGEIDLASLIEGWPSETVRSCKEAYQSARWPESTPADFERKLQAALLYWQFRWLGDRPAWTTDKKKPAWRFDQLRSIGERLGLI